MYLSVICVYTEILGYTYEKLVDINNNYQEVGEGVVGER